MPRSRPRSSSGRSTVPGRRRPVGAVVRAVPHARPDPREGDRRHRRQGRAGQGQRRREPGRSPGVPGAVDPGRVRAARTARSSTASSAPTPSTTCSSSSTACCRPRSEDELATLLAAGDEASLRQALELEPGNEDAVVALAELLVDAGRRRGGAGAAGAHPGDRAHPPGRRRAPALGDARPSDDYDATLDALLDRVKDDEEARQEFVDILELMGPDDPRTADYRRKLTGPAVLTPFPVGSPHTDIPRILRRASARRREEDVVPSAVSSDGRVPFDPAPIELRRPRSGATMVARWRLAARPWVDWFGLAPPDRRRRHRGRRRRRRLVAAALAGPPTEAGLPLAATTTAAATSAGGRGHARCAGWRGHHHDVAPTSSWSTSPARSRARACTSCRPGARVARRRRRRRRAAPGPTSTRSTSPRRSPTATGSTSPSSASTVAGRRRCPPGRRRRRRRRTGRPQPGDRRRARRAARHRSGHGRRRSSTTASEHGPFARSTSWRTSAASGRRSSTRSAPW